MKRGQRMGVATQVLLQAYTVEKEYRRDCQGPLAIAQTRHRSRRGLPKAFYREMARESSRKEAIVWDWYPWPYFEPILRKKSTSETAGGPLAVAWTRHQSCHGLPEAF